MALTQNSNFMPKRYRADPIPQIQSAGKIIVKGNEGADYSLRADVHGKLNPGTPEAIKKYRKTTNNDPGKIIVHPGLQDGQPNMPMSHAYGKKTHDSEHVNSIIKAQNLAGLADKFNDIKEAKYASAVKEPLAKGYSRQYQWPDKIDSNGNFGKATQFSDPAKQLMYPMGGDKEERMLHAKQYTKTHGNFAPGEQKNREYEWNNIDPQNHAFGYGEKRLLNGASKSIMPERTEHSFPKTVIVKKTVEDQKSIANDQLGNVKNLGQGLTKEIMEQRTFGIKNITAVNNNWNAAKCINGEPTEQELRPDKDLGISIKPNCSNTVRKPEDIHRSFGCPSIRTDIPLKVKKSVADYQNYGDEPEAVDLLFPATFQEMGITETDFQMLRSRQDIKQLFEAIGYSYKIGKFNAIFNRAKEMSGVPAQEDCCSVRAFMHAVKDLHYVE